ncbi:hypothetical protein LCGC14_2998460, partial [marine sediment metagenome]
GLAPATEGACAMDLTAAIGESLADMKTLQAGGTQGSAFMYGSAFSRGLRARTPAGLTVYVSGTAAIDADGITQHVGDIPRQIEATISHARAVLANMDCRDEDVVQSIIYCKTPEVEKVFRDRCADLSWPKIVTICDICRHDLLFEVEVAACPDAGSL